jgi:hypothetical protein
MPNISAARPVAGQPIETLWGQNVHDTVEAAPYFVLAAGTAPGTGGNNVVVGVPFGVSFVGEPFLSAMAISSDGDQFLCTFADITASSVSLIMVRNTVSAIGSGVTLYWKLLAAGTIS